MSNQWTFTGYITSITPKPVGKATVTTVVIDDRREKPALAVVDCWFSVRLPIGAAVYAAGTLAGREWQGKAYAGLRCEELHAVAVADVPPLEPEPGQAQQEQPAAPASKPIDRWLPF